MTTQALLSPTGKGGTGMRSFINSLSCTLFCEITLLGEQPKILIYLFHRLKSIFNEWSMAMPCQCVCRCLNLCAHTQMHARFARRNHGVLVWRSVQQDTSNMEVKRHQFPSFQLSAYLPAKLTNTHVGTGSYKPNPAF